VRTIKRLKRYYYGNGNSALVVVYDQMALIDYHNIVYKFSIMKDNPVAHLPNQKQMRGWIQEWEEKDFVKFQRTPHSIIIFLNKRIFRDDTGTVESEVLEMVKQHAKKFQERYTIQLDIDHPEPVRKEVKLLEGFRSADQFQGNLVKCVYPDGRIEFVDKEKAVTHTENFIENLAIESKADSIIKAMDGGINTIAYLLTQQNEIILKVLNKSSFFSRLKKSLAFHINSLRLAVVKEKTSSDSLKKLGDNLDGEK